MPFRCIVSVLFPPWNKVVKVAACLGSLFSRVVGREGHCKQMPLACVGSACRGWTTLGLPQPKAACTSWVHPAQAPGCSARALSQVGPAFCALPRSKPLRFSGAPQGTDPDRLCVLCPSQVQAAQATGCLVGRASYLPGPRHSVSARAQLQVCRMSPLGS